MNQRRCINTGGNQQLLFAQIPTLKTVKNNNHQNVLLLYITPHQKVNGLRFNKNIIKRITVQVNR